MEDIYFALSDTKLLSSLCELSASNVSAHRMALTCLRIELILSPDSIREPKYDGVRRGTLQKVFTC